MDGIATVIVRLPINDTIIESKDRKLVKNTETQYYKDEKVNSASLINGEEKYRPK